MHILLAAVLCIATGFVVTCLGWPRKAPLRAHLLLKAALSSGFGLGIFSLVFFLSLVMSPSLLLMLDAGVFSLLLVVLLWFRTRVGGEQWEQISQARETRASATIRYPPAAFAVALICALYASLMRAIANPHGSGWDAFAIWNLHARFLFRGGPHWRDGFTAMIPWSHPDYPLLLPAAIAHFWRYLGNETLWVPAVVGLVFTFSTVALLFSGLSILRGRNQAFLAGTTLLATPFFIEQGTSQYADLPLGFFFLATIVLLYLHDEAANQNTGWPVIAGLAAAFAAWTKNEGLVFFCATILARLIVMRNEGWPSFLRQAARVLPAAFPVLVVIAYFKLRVAPAGDLFSSPASVAHKLLGPARYWIILRWYAKESLRFGHWLLIPGTLLLTAYYFLIGRPATTKSETGVRTSILALVLTLASYFAIYVITPYDLYWHLRFSLNRLFLQVWPSAIFLFFMAVRTPEQALREYGN